MIRFEQLGQTTVGRGPKHPVTPNLTLRSEIDGFFKEYPELAKDRGYVDFLERYSAATRWHEDDEFSVIIYGFSDFTINLLYPDESLISQEKFFRFAEVGTKIGDRKFEDEINLDFAWDVSGKQQQGVYRRIVPWDVDPKLILYSWYCDNFLTWLDALITNKGRLF
jgi:hypothetical protein